MLRLFIGTVGATVLVIACASSASAHATLETREAPVGAPYKAVMRVPHGCDGTATIALRIRIPDGVIGVKPMPKASWTLSTVTGKYPRTYTLFHSKVSEGVVEITWSGGKLLDAHYDEFVFLTSLTGDSVRVYPMPVWLEIEQKLGAMPSTHPARLRFLERINYHGQPGELDSQGRVIVPYRLRESASMSGDVDVLGQVTWLDVWNHDRLLSKLQREPFSDDDARALAEYGV